MHLPANRQFWDTALMFSRIFQDSRLLAGILHINDIYLMFWKPTQISAAFWIIAAAKSDLLLTDFLLHNIVPPRNQDMYFWHRAHFP